MNKRSPRPRLTTCTAQRSNGGFCDDESLPDAPFPICLKHAARLMEFLNDVTPRGIEHRMVATWRAIEQDRERVAERQRIRPKTSVVYYARVGDRIKIGVTSSLPQRMRAYRPGSVLLGYEPGDLSLEAQRHREFTEDLEAGREWFRPSPRLLAHIEQVNTRRNAA